MSHVRLAVPGWTLHIPGTADMLKMFTMAKGTDYSPLINIFDNMHRLDTNFVVLPSWETYPERTELHRLLQLAFSHAEGLVVQDSWVCPQPETQPQYN